MIAQPVNSIAFSGTIPINYDRYLGPLFFEPFALDMAKRVKNDQAKNILEVACGTGRVTKHILAELSKDAHFVASDINPAMIEYAKNILQGYPNMLLEVNDAMNLPYATREFDLVVSQFGVMFYSNRPKAYTEACRVLKPGGKFIFNVWDNIDNNPAAQMTQEIVIKFFPVDTPSFYQTPFSYYDETIIREDLTSGGFYEVNMEMLNLMGFAKTSMIAAQGLLEGTPVYTAIIERDANMLTEMKEILAERLSKHFGKTNLQVPLQARVVTAIKSDIIDKK